MPAELDPNATYGRLTPVRPAGKSATGHPLWELRCSCGATKVARVYRVLEGRTTSCGCLHADSVRQANRERTGVRPNDTFSRLTAVSECERDGKVVRWLFRCSCGAEVVLNAAKVKSGHTRSCGCYNRESASSRRFKHGVGGRQTKEYRAWRGLRQRCHNPKNPGYADYGGRGITVCDRWQGPDGFAHFLADVGLAPSPAHSIDRLDNSRGYEPGNCAWRTRVEQMNNRRGNILLTHNSETLTLAAWAKRVGLKRGTLAARLRCGWPAHLALTVRLKNECPTQQTG